MAQMSEGNRKHYINLTEEMRYSIRRQRNHLGLSIKDVSEKAGVNWYTLQKIETVSEYVLPETYNKIALVLGLDHPAGH